MKTHSACLLLAAIVILYPAAGSSGEVRSVIHLDPPAIVDAGAGYSIIRFPGSVQAGMAGCPSYPYLGAAVLLPPGEEAVDVRVVRRGLKEIRTPLRLHPRQHPKTGIETSRGEGLLVRRAAYAFDGTVSPPDGRFTTRYFRGHPVVTEAFCPVTYVPATGRAAYYSEIELVVTTAPGTGPAGSERLLRDDPVTLSRLAAIVDNPEDVPAAGLDGAQGGCSGGYDLLIVTVDEFAAAFGALQDFYERRGTRTALLTVEEIDSSWPGADLQEKIRSAVIDYYAVEGIDHLLLAGDGDPGGIASVPFRGLYCTVQSSTLYEDASIPADLYYAALDGDWNTDGDTLWGEPGEDDLYCEISVGRMPVDSQAEAEAMVSKTMMYQDSPVAADARRALMLGEHLWSDPETWGGDEMDQLIGHCEAWDFVTDGIPEDFDIVKYYDRDIGSWPSATVWTEVDSGTAWICHSGHSNSQYAMRMGVWDVNTYNFTNDGVSAGYPVVYTYGCYAGAFDADDCIAEEMVTIETFAAAVVCHSRYGWFTEGTTNGPSHHFQREFFDAVFAEGTTRLGPALSRAKDETVPFLDLPDEYEPGAHRWCFYCLNLLGDPAMEAWTGEILPIYADYAPSMGRDDGLFFLETGQEGVTAALYAAGSCLGSGVSGPDGRIIITLCDTIPSSADSVDLTLTAHDRQPWSDRLPLVETTDSDLPVAAALLGIYPNPFNPSAEVSFQLPVRCEVDLSAYTADGRRVARLASGEMEAGPHTVTWRPVRLSSGVYFLVLRAGEGFSSRKAVLLR